MGASLLGGRARPGREAPFKDSIHREGCPSLTLHLRNEYARFSMSSPCFRIALIALLFALPSLSSADDGDLRLLRESIGYIEVADAADDEDPFDFNLSLGFRHDRVSGNITREMLSPVDGSVMQKVGDYSATRSYLDVAAEIGLYRDLAVRLMVPVLLSYDQSITDIESAATPLLGSQDAVSPTRSGIPEIIVGLAWQPMNQMRRADRPNWTWLFNVALPTGKVMSPCLDVPGSSCASNAGVSTGVVRLLPEWRLSYRFRYVETYGGLKGEIPFPTASRDSLFTPGGQLLGYRKTRPSIRGGFIVGAALIPWERRATHQRLAIDMRFHAHYVSGGRDFSPLFDVLGDPNLSPTPRFPEICEDGSVAGTGGVCNPGDPYATRFTGLTTTQSHGNIGGRLTLEIKAARYITFYVSSGLQWITSHLLTTESECNASVDRHPQDAINCNVGRPNPHYQREIDMVGNRFGVGNLTNLDLVLRAQGTF